MIADNRVQMPAAQLTQAALQMPDRCSVSDIAQNPQLVVLADNPIDIGHDCFIVRIGVCGLAEIEPGIVKHHALRPILGGLASLRGEESVILRVPRSNVVNPRSTLTSGCPKCVSVVKYFMICCSF